MGQDIYESKAGLGGSEGVYARTGRSRVEMTGDRRLFCINWPWSSTEVGGRCREKAKTVEVGDGGGYMKGMRPEGTER